MMTKTGLKINGIANIVMAVSFLAATIIILAAIGLSDWLWWQRGLGVCGVISTWGLMLAGVAQIAPEWR